MLQLFLFFVATLAISNSARILVYIPTPSISHQEPFRPLTQELSKRGHEVVVITADTAFPEGGAPANLKEIDLHSMSYDIIKKSLPEFRGDKDQWIKHIEEFVFDFFTYLLDKQFETTEVQEVIQDGKFDLLIIEGIARPLLGLTHVIKAPVILVSSLGLLFDNAEALGCPSHPILYPSPLRQKLNNLTFWEKFNELYNHYKILKIAYKKEEEENKFLRKHFGNDIPTISELKNNIDMMFLNIHPIFEGNHPVPPSVIYMWGIHKKPQKELPKDLKILLDTSKKGVIYMSFGTNTDPTYLPKETIQAFVKVFCQLPYDVLWKWNNEELPGRCQNIRIAKWFPQSDLLRHPNIKLFITQGGMQSTDEAIAAGVPLVGIPMLGDQWYNVEKYEHLKIGLQLDFETLTEEKFKDAVETVINDDSYRRNIRRLDALMRDEPTRPLQRAVWWVEHVLRHGGARHLRAPAANISWVQYFEVYFILQLLAIFLISLLLAFLVIYCLYVTIRRHFVDHGKLKKN